MKKCLCCQKEDCTCNCNDKDNKKNRFCYRCGKCGKHCTCRKGMATIEQALKENEAVMKELRK